MQVAMNDVTRVELTPVRCLGVVGRFHVRELKVHSPSGDLTVTLYSVCDGAPEVLDLVSADAPKDIHDPDHAPARA